MATFRDKLYVNRRCCELSFLQALQLTLAETFLGARYQAATGQDKWVLHARFPGVTDGFFVEVGAADGVLNSNSKVLEDRGWKGICIDPFPTNMDQRRCRVVKAVVSSTPGRVVNFHAHGELGGMADTLGIWKDLATASPAVELTTTTVGHILDEAGAPAFIHFLSVDVEGAELEALRGIPFDKYRFGAIALEHNDEEPKRTDVRTFLEGNGYVRVHTYKQDDFYALAR